VYKSLTIENKNPVKIKIITFFEIFSEKFRKNEKFREMRKFFLNKLIFAEVKKSAVV
jgi:hypothetical protein